MESFLVCEICKGPYEDPRILPCFHTFCSLCLRSRFDDKQTKRLNIIFTCPICKLTFHLNSDIVSLEKNYFVSKCISLQSDLNAVSDEINYFLEDYISDSTYEMITKIQQEVKWTQKILKDIDLNFNELKENFKKEGNRIERFAMKIGDDKNKNKLLHDLKSNIRNEEAIVEAKKTNLFIYLYGLQYHEDKIKNLVDEEDLNDELRIKFDCDQFINYSVDLKNLNGETSLKDVEFVKYPRDAYVLGLLRYIKYLDETVSHVDPSGRINISSTIKFAKKLRTLAYCHERSELFFFFPSCKDVFVLNVTNTPSTSQALPREHYLGGTNQLIPFSKGRKIVVCNLEDANDAVVCSKYIFISERSTNRLHKVSILRENSNEDMFWNIKSYNCGLSVTPVDTILVACNISKFLIEYDMDGTRIRTINISHIGNPRHALFLPNEFSSRLRNIGANASHAVTSQNRNKVDNYFAVCLAGEKHEIVIIDSAGEIMSIYSKDKLNYPIHLTPIKNNSEVAFLACDRFNRRLLLLHWDLTFARQLNFHFKSSLDQKQDHDLLGIKFTETFYDTRCNDGEEYKIKCPSKTLLTENGVVFVVDEDNNSLLRLETLSNE